MDANLLGECIHRSSEPILICNSSRDISNFSSIDLNCSEKGVKCCHFSIRGYVASVRNRDMKACWPFPSTYGESNLETSEKLLPPIAVAEFRWWNCENCLLEDCATESEEPRECLPDDNFGRKILPDINVDLELDGNMQTHLVANPFIRYKVPLFEAMPVNERCKPTEETVIADATDQGTSYRLEEKISKKSLQTHQVVSEDHCKAGELAAFQLSRHPCDFNRNHSFYQLPLSPVEESLRSRLCNGSPDLVKSNAMPEDARITCQPSYDNRVTEGSENADRKKTKSSTEAVSATPLPMENDLISRFCNGSPDLMESSAMPEDARISCQSSYENRVTERSENVDRKKLKSSTDAESATLSPIVGASMRRLCNGSPDLMDSNAMPEDDCQPSYGNRVTEGSEDVDSKKLKSSTDAVSGSHPSKVGTELQLHDERSHTELNSMLEFAKMASKQSNENGTTNERKNVDRKELVSTIGSLPLSQIDNVPTSDEFRVPEPSNQGPVCENHGMLPNNDVIVESEEEEDDIDPQDNEHGVLTQRRVRKTRMLSDILEREAARVQNVIPSIPRISSVNSEDEATDYNVNDSAKEFQVQKNSQKNDSAKADSPKENVGSPSEKNSKSKTVTAVFGGETTHIDGINSERSDNLKDEVKHATKKDGKSRVTPAISEVEGISFCKKNSRKFNKLKEEVKHKTKKHKKCKAIPAITGNEASHNNDKNSGDNGKLKGESKCASKKHKLPSQGKKVAKKHKKSSKLLEIEDEGSSLIHWMRRTSRKHEACGQAADSKCANSIDTRTGSQRTIPSVIPSPRKTDQPCSHEENIEKNNNKSKTSSVEIRRTNFSHQRLDIKDSSTSADGCREIKSRNCHVAPENPSSTNSPLMDSESRSFMMGADKVSLGNPQIEKPQARDNGKLPISQEQESVTMIKAPNETGRCLSAERKQTVHGEEQKVDTSVDGIPVEILKLLQANWYKRHQDEGTSVKMGDTSMVKEIEGEKQLKRIDLNVDEASIEPQMQQKHNVPSYPFSSLEKELIFAQPKKHQGRTLPQVSFEDQYNTTEKQNNEDQASGICSKIINLNMQFNISSGVFESSEQAANVFPIHHVPISWKGCLHQDLNQKLLTIRERDGSEGCNIPSFIYHGDDPNALVASTNFGIKDLVAPNLQISAKGKDSLTTDSSVKRKRMTGETALTKALGDTVARPQKRKQQVINFQSCMETPPSEISNSGARAEYNPDIIRPPDIRTNETISALNLLRLMDPDVCSSTQICASTDKNSCKFNSNFSNNHVPKGSFKVISGHRSDRENRNPQALENVNWHYHSQNPLNIHNPAQRIGGHTSYFRDGVTNSPSDDPRTLFCPFSGKGNVEVGSYLQNSTEHTRSMSACQTRVVPYSCSFNNGNQGLGLCHQNQTNLPSGSMDRQRQMDKVEAVQILKDHCPAEICVVNRNPADFTIPGEDNEYMTGYEDLKPRGSFWPEAKEYLIYPEHPRKWKAVSFVASKGFLRS